MEVKNLEIKDIPLTLRARFVADSLNNLCDIFQIDLMLSTDSNAIYLDDTKKPKGKFVANHYKDFVWLELDEGN